MRERSTSGGAARGPRAPAFLRAVEEGLQRALDGVDDAPPLLGAARQLALAPGAKRVRPRLLEMAARPFGVAKAALVRAAVAGELIHTASLLHDDVVDEGTLRRGRPTANALFGNAAAVLAGDFVLSRALELLPREPAALLLGAVELVRRMSRASMLETSARGSLRVGLAGWRDIAEGKTGDLFGWCCAAPALLASDRAAEARLRRCGRHLGVAFQLGDDLLDLRPAGSGKDPFADLRSRTPSFPILTAAAQSPRLRSRIEELWRAEAPPAEAVASVGEEMLAFGVEGQTIEAIEVELEGARRALAGRAAGAAAIIDWAAERWSVEESRFAV